jgi:hypothetical protein
MNKKGFIGAIGDDLPSLIPIFLGLVIFFSVFLSVFNDYNAKNNIYNLNQEAIEISMELKSDPVIVDHNHFIDKCNKIKTSKKWTAFLVDLPLDTNDFNPISIEQITEDYKEVVLHSKDSSDDEHYYICGFDIGDQDIVYDRIEELEDLQRRVIIYLYPLILQRETGFSTPARLYVLIWE